MKKFLLLLIVISLFFSCKKDSKNEMVIKIPLVTWGGYAALFAANNGASANKDSLFYKYGGFMVDLVQEENPALQLQGFANGTYPIIWSTMDMIPLSYDSLSQDTRTIPKVIGVFDYSKGGDGIVVRGDIKSGADIRGKKVVTSQFSPSHFFLLWYLNQNGLTTDDIQPIYAADAIAAKDAYIADKSIDVCVTWSPFIYDITDKSKDTYIEGSQLLITTAEDSPAYGAIADVYLARTDFIQNNPEIIKAFTKAMLEGYDLFNANQDKVAKEIADLFGIKGGAEEVKLMFGDVTIAGKEENKTFFDDTANFSGANILKLSTELYKKNGSVLDKDFDISSQAVIAKEFMIEAIK